LIPSRLYFVLPWSWYSFPYLAFIISWVVLLYISGRGIYDFISKSYANRVGHVYGFVFSLAQPVLNIFNKIFFCILKKKLAKNKYATYNKIMLAFGFSHSIIHGKI
jgi:hypothetical protein